MSKETKAPKKTTKVDEVKETKVEETAVEETKETAIEEVVEETKVEETKGEKTLKEETKETKPKDKKAKEPKEPKESKVKEDMFLYQGKEISESEVKALLLDKISEVAANRELRLMKTGRPYSSPTLGVIKLVTKEVA